MFARAGSTRRRTIGCSFDGGSPQLVQLIPRTGGLEASAALCAPLPSMSAMPRAEWRPAVAEVLRSALDRGGFTGRRVVACLPAEQITYCRLRLAATPESELQSVVFWRTVKELSLDPRDARIDYYDAGEVIEAGRPLHEVISVAASLADLELLVAVLHDAALAPLAVDTPPGALARCLSADADGGARLEPRLVIDLGPTSSTLFVARAGAPCFIHRVHTGREHAGDMGGIEALAAELMHEVNLCAHHLSEVGPAECVPQRGCVVGAGTSEQAVLEVINRDVPFAFEPLAEALLPRLWPLIASAAGGATADTWLRALGLALYDRKDVLRVAA